MKSNQEAYSRHIEDEYKSAYLQRPSPQEHNHVSIDIKAPFFQQIVQCTKHILSQGHSDPLETFKYSVKGALVGAFVAGYIGSTWTSKSPLFYKKIMNYIKANTFGTSKMAYQLLKPGMLIGAAMGGSHYLFYSMIWRRESKNPMYQDLIIGNGIYGAAWTALLWHPQKWWAGLYGGALLGFLYFCMVHQLEPSRGTKGYQMYFDNGMSQEDRQKQEYRDKIHELGYLPTIQAQQMERI